MLFLKGLPEIKEKSNRKTKEINGLWVPLTQKMLKALILPKTKQFRKSEEGV